MKIMHVTQSTKLHILVEVEARVKLTSKLFLRGLVGVENEINASFQLIIEVEVWQYFYLWL